MKTWRLGIVIGTLTAVVRADFVFYVAPTGNDSNTGTTTAAPLRTLTGARNALRMARANDPTDSLKSATIYLREGLYWTSSDLGNTLNQLQLSAEDSGQSADHPVTWTSYPGERAMVHGGVRLLGWIEVAQLGNDKLWKTNISAWNTQFFLPYPRDLYVNNRRMIRSRFPDISYVPGTPVLANSSYLEVVGNFPAPDNGRKFRLAGTLPPADPLHLGYANSGVFQMIARTEWVAPRQQIVSAAASGSDTVVTLANDIGQAGSPWYGVWAPNGRPPHNLPGDPVFLEGAFEFLSGANSTYEWYLQPSNGAGGTGAGDVWVRLPANLDPRTTTSVVAPRSAFLVKVDGASYVQFVGIDFGFTNFDTPVMPTAAPSTGWFPRGGGYSYYDHDASAVSFEYPFPAAIVLDNCSSCYVSRCRVAHVGATGMALRLGSGNVIEANEVFDTGATGIFVGRKQVHWQHTTKPYNSAITDNYVHDVGVAFPDAVGIKTDWINRASVFRNEIAMTPYAGLHAGVWGEDYTTMNGAGHSIDVYCAWNRIHHAVTWLVDGGGFHPVGVTDGSSFRDNVVHDVFQDYWYGGARRGIEMDINAADWVVNNNVLYRLIGSAVPFSDLNCTSPINNWYPNPPNYFDEQAATGYYCGGGAQPANTIIDPNFLTPGNPNYNAVQSIINASGPASIFRTFLFSTFDSWVHPY